MDFKNKKVLITGGSRGIGKATAIAFADKGASIGINFRSDLVSAQRTLNELNGKAHQLLQYDISIKNSQKDLIKDFISKFGCIDILVNNGGISIEHDIEDVDFEDWTSAWEQTF